MDRITYSIEGEAVGKQVVEPSGDVRVLGPYSPAVRAGGFVHLAGQLGWDFDADGLAPGGIEAETRQAITNLEAVLESCGLDLTSVVKVTLFLVDMAEWPTVNTIWSKAFPTDPPVRTAVAVAALPKGARVELDVLAVDG